jgi:hypothetical protein
MVTAQAFRVIGDTRLVGMEAHGAIAAKSSAGAPLRV